MAFLFYLFILAVLVSPPKKIFPSGFSRSVEPFLISSFVEYLFVLKLCGVLVKCLGFLALGGVLSFIVGSVSPLPYSNSLPHGGNVRLGVLFSLGLL